MKRVGEREDEIHFWDKDQGNMRKWVLFLVSLTPLGVNPGLPFHSKYPPFVSSYTGKSKINQLQGL